MQPMRQLIFAATLLTALAFNGSFAKDNGAANVQLPVSERALCKHVNGESFVRTELFFGLSRPAAPEVSEQEFQGFVDAQITPRFPDGLTVLSGKGQFKNAAGITIQEGSKLVILLYPFNKQASAAIDAIRTDYKSMFQQESVLRVDELTCVSF